jgi:acyl-CoA-binding protein
MSELEQAFKQAAEDVQKLRTRPSNQDLLQLYSLFKQGSVGDVTGKRPGRLDFKGRAKYDAWARVRGMPQETAMQSYIDLVKRLTG